MTRAALADQRLLSLKDIHELLGRAAAELGAAGESAAETALVALAFDSTLEAALRAQMKEIGYVYVGDLVDGEAYEGELLGIEEVGDWTVVGLNERRVSLILDVKVKVRVEVQYEDRDHAIYDREDDRWIGAEIASTEVEEEIDIEVLADVKRKTGAVRDAKVLTQEVSIHGPSEWES